MSCDEPFYAVAFSALTLFSYIVYREHLPPAPPVYNGPTALICLDCPLRESLTTPSVISIFPSLQWFLDSYPTLLSAHPWARALFTGGADEAAVWIIQTTLYIVYLKYGSPLIILFGRQFVLPGIDYVLSIPLAIIAWLFGIVKTILDFLLEILVTIFFLVAGFFSESFRYIRLLAASLFSRVIKPGAFFIWLLVASVTYEMIVLLRRPQLPHHLRERRAHHQHVPGAWMWPSEDSLELPPMASGTADTTRTGFVSLCYNLCSSVLRALLRGGVLIYRRLRSQRTELQNSPRSDRPEADQPEQHEKTSPSSSEANRVDDEAARIAKVNERLEAVMKPNVDLATQVWQQNWRDWFAIHGQAPRTQFAQFGDMGNRSSMPMSLRQSLQIGPAHGLRSSTSGLYRTVSTQGPAPIARVTKSTAPALLANWTNVRLPPRRRLGLVSPKAASTGQGLALSKGKSKDTNLQSTPDYLKRTIPGPASISKAHLYSPVTRAMHKSVQDIKSVLTQRPQPGSPRSGHEDNASRAPMPGPAPAPVSAPVLRPKIMHRPQEPLSEREQHVEKLFETGVLSRKEADIALICLGQEEEDLKRLEASPTPMLSPFPEIEAQPVRSRNKHAPAADASPLAARSGRASRRALKAKVSSPPPDTAESSKQRSDPLPTSRSRYLVDAAAVKLEGQSQKSSQTVEPTSGLSAAVTPAEPLLTETAPVEDRPTEPILVAREPAEIPPVVEAEPADLKPTEVKPAEVKAAIIEPAVAAETAEVPSAVVEIVEDKPAETVPASAATTEVTATGVVPEDAAVVEVEAAPVEAAPVEAAPVEAAPVEAAPVEAAPIQVEAASVEIETEPIQAAAVQNAAAEQTPAPADTVMDDDWSSEDEELLKRLANEIDELQELEESALLEQQQMDMASDEPNEVSFGMASMANAVSEVEQTQVAPGNAQEDIVLPEAQDATSNASSELSPPPELDEDQARLFQAAQQRAAAHRGDDAMPDVVSGTASIDNASGTVFPAPRPGLIFGNVAVDYALSTSGPSNNNELEVRPTSFQFGATAAPIARPLFGAPQPQESQNVFRFAAPRDSNAASTYIPSRGGQLETMSHLFQFSPSPAFGAGARQLSSGGSQQSQDPPHSSLFASSQVPLENIDPALRDVPAPQAPNKGSEQHMTADLSHSTGVSVAGADQRQPAPFEAVSPARPQEDVEMNDEETVGLESGAMSRSQVSSDDSEPWQPLNVANLAFLNEADSGDTDSLDNDSLFNDLPGRDNGPATRETVNVIGPQPGATETPTRGPAEVVNDETAQALLLSSGVAGNDDAGSRPRPEVLEEDNEDDLYNPDQAEPSPMHGNNEDMPAYYDFDVGAAGAYGNPALGPQADAHEYVNFDPNNPFGFDNNGQGTGYFDTFDATYYDPGNLLGLGDDSAPNAGPEDDFDYLGLGDGAAPLPEFQGLASNNPVFDDPAWFNAAVAAVPAHQAVSVEPFDAPFDTGEFLNLDDANLPGGDELQPNNPPEADAGTSTSLPGVSAPASTYSVFENPEFFDVERAATAGVAVTPSQPDAEDSESVEP